MVIIITSKECIHCHKTKKVSNYYIHRDNKPGYGLDNTCKECSKKISSDLEGLKLYANMNSRQFNQELYDIACKLVKEKYENDVEINSLPEEKRESFLFEKIRNAYFSQQSQTQFYQYLCTDESQNNIEDNVSIEEENLEDDTELNKKEKEKKIYSQDWRGSYTRSQIDWLDAYYADTLEDYTVKTRNHKDYCRKIAKASLAMDEASDDMLNNVVGAEKRYDKAKAAFNLFSDSAKLSEKTRSANDVAGHSSLSEVVQQLEKTGFLQKKRNYETDDIDKIDGNFRHTITSVGGSF